MRGCRVIFAVFWTMVLLTLFDHCASAQEFTSAFLVDAGSQAVFHHTFKSSLSTVKAVWGKVEVVEGYILYTAPGFYPPEGKDAIAISDGKQTTYVEEIVIQKAHRYLARANALAVAQGMDPDGDGYFEVTVNSDEELQQYNAQRIQDGEEPLTVEAVNPDVELQEMQDSGETLKLPAPLMKQLNTDSNYVSGYSFNDGQMHGLKQFLPVPNDGNPHQRAQKRNGVRFPFFSRPAGCDPTQTSWEIVGPWSNPIDLGLINTVHHSWSGSIDTNWLAQLNNKFIPLPPIHIQGSVVFNTTYDDTLYKVKRTQKIDMWRCKDGIPVWVGSYYRVQYGTRHSVQPQWMAPAVGGGWSDIQWGPIQNVP